jgi:hypothetical protein
MRTVHIILGFTFILGMVYEIIPKGLPLVEPFVFNREPQYIRFHIYLIFEHLIKALVSVCILFRTKITVPIKAFFLLSVMDTFDYIVAGSTVWGHIYWIPISWNTIQMSIYLISFIHYERNCDE